MTGHDDNCNKYDCQAGNRPVGQPEADRISDHLLAQFGPAIEQGPGVVILNWADKDGHLETFPFIFKAGGWTEYNREQFECLVGVAWLNSIGHDVWFSLHYVRTDAIYRMAACGGRASEKEVQAVTCIAADIDAGKPGYPTQAEVLEALKRCPLAPSMVNLSGKLDGGVHAFWMLDEPFVIESGADRAAVKDISRRWQLEVLKPLLDGQGKLDSTFDLARVLRPAGTVNHKYGCVVEPIQENNRRYSLSEIEAALPEPSDPTLTSGASSHAPRTAPGASAPPPDRTGRRPASLDVLQRAAAYAARCKPAVSGHGGHNQALRVAAALVRGFDLSPTEAYPILAAYNATCAPPWSEGELHHKLASADAYDDPRGRGWLLGTTPPEDDDAADILDLDALFSDAPPTPTENRPDSNTYDAFADPSEVESVRLITVETTPVITRTSPRTCPNSIPLAGVMENGPARVAVPCRKRTCEVCGIAWAAEWARVIIATVARLLAAGDAVYAGTVAGDMLDTVRRSAARRAARDGIPWAYATVSTGLDTWLLVATASFPGATEVDDPEQFTAAVQAAAEEARWSTAGRPVRISQHWRAMGGPIPEPDLTEPTFTVVAGARCPSRYAYETVLDWLGRGYEHHRGASGVAIDWSPELFADADNPHEAAVHFFAATKLLEDEGRAAAHGYVESVLRASLRPAHEQEVDRLADRILAAFAHR